MLTAEIILGFVGDICTFAGGVLLSIDALGKHREFTKLKNLTDAVKDPLLPKLNLTKAGISLKVKDDVKEVFIHRSVERALWGAVIVTIGFVFLIIARVFE